MANERITASMDQHAGNVDHDVGRQSWCTDVHDGNVANRSYGTLGHPVL